MQVRFCKTYFSPLFFSLNTYAAVGSLPPGPRKIHVLCTHTCFCMRIKTEGHMTAWHIPTWYSIRRNVIYSETTGVVSITRYFEWGETRYELNCQVRTEDLLESPGSLRSALRMTIPVNSHVAKHCATDNSDSKTPKTF